MTSSAPTMFSPDDIRDLFDLFPPTDILKGLGTEFDSAPLLRSPSGQGLVIRDHIVTQFEEIGARSSERIPLGDLSRQLDVEPDVLLRLARSSPQLVLLETRAKVLICKKERDELLRTLDVALRNGLVSAPQFCREHSLAESSFGDLIVSLQGGDIGNSIFHVRNAEQSSDVEYCMHSSYEETLRKAIALCIEQSEAKPVIFNAEVLPGAPPRWLIARSLQAVLRESDSEVLWQLNNDENSVICIPQDYLIRERDAVIEQFRQGKTQYIDIHAFKATFARLHSTNEDALGYISKNSGCQTCVYRQYVLRSDYNDTIRTFFVDGARLQAKDHWQKLPKNPESTGHVHLSLISDAYLQNHKEDPNTPTVLQAVTAEMKKDAEQAYSEELTGLESGNEAEFCGLWTERIMTWFHSYKLGAIAIEDTKLRGQLEELLLNHITNELIPETLTRADTQGLLRSRRTQKNTRRFRNILKPPPGEGNAPSDIEALSAVVDKFEKKQGIKRPDAQALVSIKESQVKDLVRRMQNFKDGAALFLTLVVILLAKRQEGIVYATGKFAPKLLKLLKGSVDPNQYDQLEKWKDAVKERLLSKEDKDQMKAMASVP